MNADPRIAGSQYEDSPVATGVAIFAGVMLATMSTFQILQGLAAVFEDTFFVSGLQYVYEIDVTAWGWIHIVLGAIGVAVGIGILGGRTWALAAGMGIAVISALNQFLFMPYYPFWAILLIGMNILVVWALANQLGQPR